MSSLMGTCPHEKALVVLADPNAHSGAELDDANEHVAECRKCQNKLANWASAFMSAAKKEKKKKKN